MYKKTLIIICSLLFVVNFLLQAEMLDSPGEGVNPKMLDSLTVSVLDSCLAYLHLEPFELGFEKAWVKDDTFKLQVIDHLLDNPLDLPKYVEETVNTADMSLNDPVKFLEFASRQLDCELGNVEIENSGNALELLERAMIEAEKYRKQALADLDEWELHDLIMSVPGLWADEEDPSSELLKGAWQHEFQAEVDTSRVVDKDRILNIIKKIDRVALNKAGLIFSGAVWEIYKNTNWEDEELTPPNHLLMGVQGEIVAHLETSFGSIVIGGKGDNIYSQDFAIIIDLGGNDIYRCRAGGAMGELGNPFSAVIDYGGNDLYFEGEKAVNQGSGFLGCGILIDAEGDDIYHGADYSQGVGIFGTGILYDQTGQDDYRVGVFGQAAGNVGIGLLFDEGEGDDRYFAKVWAQGLGSVFGYGMLQDGGGDDTYRTGGAYLHAPLLPNDYQSFSHGFGMGWRPRAGGGIGVLYDVSGNDFYDGEVFCEGSAYWYSLGMLIDGGGNDSYNAAQYGQGAGIHLAIGALWDRGGDDQYHSRNGVIGGTAHDLSVGLLVDENGDDYYTVSGGYGVALTNSFALFIDKLGDDMYSTKEDLSFGAVRWDRGFAGCGIFLDLEGNDRYSRNTLADNGKLWTFKDWGIGLDLDRNIIASAKEEPLEEIILTAEDSLKMVEELYEEASLWAVGSNRQKVARAVEAFKAKGMEAVLYICENKLATDSSLELRLIDIITEAYPDSIAPLLLTKITDANEKVQKNSIRLLGVTKYQDAVEPLLKMLKKKKYHELRRSLIGALGRIGDKTATAEIIKFIADDEELCRLTVVGALSSLKDESAVPTLISALDDKIFTVRSAALDALKSFKDPKTADLLLSQSQRPNTQYPEIAVKALNNYLQSTTDSTSTAYEKQKYQIMLELEDLAENENELIRAEALSTLWKNGRELQKQQVELLLENEYSPFVKAVVEESGYEMKEK
ncbi:MAG: HEAT repeat domain-containing protein [Candidatus Cloacimonadales bacterium]|nr:HEAT repeat domain-containing protein [Candidatus Cloacimonadales bacterium]